MVSLKSLSAFFVGLIPKEGGVEHICDFRFLGQYTSFLLKFCQLGYSQYLAKLFRNLRVPFF